VRGNWTQSDASLKLKSSDATTGSPRLRRGAPPPVASARDRPVNGALRCKLDKMTPYLSTNFNSDTDFDLYVERQGGAVPVSKVAFPPLVL